MTTLCFLVMVRHPFEVEAACLLVHEAAEAEAVAVEVAMEIQERRSVDGSHVAHGE